VHPLRSRQRGEQRHVEGPRHTDGNGGSQPPGIQCRDCRGCL